MRPEWQWTGSEDSKAGTAHYEVGEVRISMHLPDFETAHSLAKFIERAYVSGRRAGYRKARLAVENALLEATGELL